ncbi:bifunctional glutamate N-acetyltransferase/amino-acid acetyltransferase ArgJ [Deferrisoma camini]|uniref:bifunctional glutamate N-acetyltransferase/amino-acid acetyltransferase ArgJ n=1 Tax=Deferrisoma camini TaxID=1035120 RepID=UPI00046CDA44|nr:bifunctional glutamate N-acetyltransferase/amino-acid acetyltransferase ArgJ [Deferrisoma camini]
MIPRGFRFGAVRAGIKGPGRLDMGLLWCETPASAAGVFTRNRVVAAPVVLCRERVVRGTTRAVLVNAGNANACTGEAGLADARRLTAAAARELGVAPEEVLMCSTGVIGARLPVDRMEKAIPALRASLAEDPDPFARSILTTDRFPKISARSFRVEGREVCLVGVAKGAGMIRPDMGTMLAFLATDAAVEPPLLRQVLVQAVDRTFNRITVDGDTSTNDTVLLLAGGAAGVAPADAPGGLDALAEAVEGVCRDLARMIVADGEGATKVVEVRVVGAADEASALRIARTVAESPLVKTAIHGEDPNWGRIAAALGRSGAYGGGPFHIAVGGVEIVRDGLGLGLEAEAEAHRAMTGREFEIRITLDEGAGEAAVTTCDLSAEYVRINADYRS